MGLLKAKFMTIFVGVILIILSLVGYFFLDYCEVDPGALAGDVSNALDEPLTLSVLYAIGGFFTFLGQTFVAILCPVLNFMDSLLAFFWYFLIGVAVVLIGWFLVP